MSLLLENCGFIAVGKERIEEVSKVLSKSLSKEDFKSYKDIEHLIIAREVQDSISHIHEESDFSNEVDLIPLITKYEDKITDCVLDLGIKYCEMTHGEFSSMVFDMAEDFLDKENALEPVDEEEYCKCG